MTTLTSDVLRAALQGELSRRGVVVPPRQRRDCEVPPVIRVDGVAYPLHPPQLEAWNAEQRIVAIFAGWQAGKTVLGPAWLMREMQRKGPGDYVVIGPDHPMILNKAKPEMEQEFRGLYRSSGDEWFLNKLGEVLIYGSEQEQRTRILFRHAQRPEAIEAFTAKAVWVEEPGQIADEVWRAIKPRLMIYRARVLLTARPYTFNWYVREIWDACMQIVGGAPVRRPDADPTIAVINFPSSANPLADVEFINAQRELMPDSEYQMRYLGIPARPAGAVYDCFDSVRHVVEMGEPPASWPRYLGLDFGPDNTAAVKVAAERQDLGHGKWGELTGRFIVYGEYHEGGMTAEEHVVAITNNQPDRFRAVGGNKTGEQGWRGYYSLAGLPVEEPRERLVEVGIQYAYRLFKSGRLLISSRCPKLIRDIVTYVYKLDADGNSTGQLDPSFKAKFHLADALRYVAQKLYAFSLDEEPEPVAAGTMAYYIALDDYHANNKKPFDDSGSTDNRWGREEDIF